MRKRAGTDDHNQMRSASLAQALAILVLVLMQTVFAHLDPRVLFPFATWDLFSNLPRPGDYADLVIVQRDESTGQEIKHLASHWEKDRPAFDRRAIWNLAQRIQGLGCGDQACVLAAQADVKNRLRQARIPWIRVEVSRVEDHLATYLLRPAAEARQRLNPRMIVVANDL